MHCSFVSLEIARFDEVLRPDQLPVTGPAGAPRFWGVGLDAREAGGSGSTGPGRVVASLALHDDEASALLALATPHLEHVDGLSPSTTWSALLSPFTHRGAVNWLDPEDPGPVLRTHLPPADGEPTLVITTVGYDVGPGFDPGRARDFDAAVSRVHDTIGTSSGLRFHHVFNFHDHRKDPVTVTMWDSDRDIRAFAYRSGRHRDEVDRYRELGTADRTSFTRLHVLSERGTQPRR